MSDGRIALIYDESLRALEDQARVVDNVRTRATNLLGAASITAAFLGQASLGRHKHWTLAGWVAVGSFVSVGIVIALLLTPIGDWKFINSARSMFAIIDNSDLDEDQFRSEAALHLEDNRLANEPRVVRMMQGLQLATACLVVEVISFAINLRR